MDRKEIRRLKLSELASGGGYKTKASLADAIGISPSLLNRYLSGDKNIGELMRDKIENELSLPSGYLDTLHGELSERISNDYIEIQQHHDAHGAMGNGVLLRNQPGQITGWKVTAEWIDRNIPAHTGIKNLAIVTGFGDSMVGDFNSGDPILIDTGIKTLDYDGMYFFRVGEEGFIKTLQRIPGDGIRVISTNKKYESWTIKEEMDFEVFGKVLTVWESMSF